MRGGGECCARQVHRPVGSRPPAGSVAGSVDAGVSGAGFSCLVPSGLDLCVPAGASMESHGVLTHRCLSSSHGIYSATQGSVRCQRESPFCRLVISADVCRSHRKEGARRPQQPRSPCSSLLPSSPSAPPGSAPPTPSCVLAQRWPAQRSPRSPSTPWPSVGCRSFPRTSVADLSVL